ncbi:ABC transporter permease [Diplocloster agilis]|uniref:ABC transporter permease n=1 Tax=Diplocloster agilis TaxID=2850323 RepID=A0A949K4T8_9FIRM|nr:MULTISPECIES: ABC transporter permease [Lachnospiraceae]MBU9738970.1 ABC transporter permease [Diplocloster agilis]MCU6735921.1 ABC transporter permease [Suonthocola fibrivorans]SCJ84091.1 L-arabinose transporter permease protein [uncultured Clostridium sp.]
MNIETIWISTIRMSIPLTLAATGSIFCERAGIISLVLEGMMLSGAFAAVCGSYYTGSALAGVLCGILAGTLIGLLHGILSLRYKVNQVISGVGLNLLVTAVTTLSMQLLWGNRGNSPQVQGIPHFTGVLSGQSVMTFITLALTAGAWFVMMKTRYGLRLRLTGESPEAAQTLGLPVQKLKYSGVLVCGAFCGLAGAYLSLDHLNLFVREMTAGRGYIAYVVAIFGRYHPVGALLGALFFGFFDAFQISLQGKGLPPQLFVVLPYVVTILIITFAVKNIRQPDGLGKL